ATIRGRKSVAAVVADLHALPLRADDQLLRILRVNDQRVDNPVSGAHPLEILVVHRLPQSAGGSRVKNTFVRGIHANQLRAAENARDALIFDPLRSTVRAVVDAGA